MRGSYRADHRGRLFNFVWPFARYAFTNLTVTIVGVPLFFIFNRTRIIGRDRVPQGRNTLLLSNHQSMIDSFLVGIGAFWPQSLLKPYLVPWNPAAEENFYRPRWLGLLSDLWKCIPVRPGRRDLRALHRMRQALRSGTMTLFPEGTRSRDGTIGRGRPGSALLILANRPAVVPVTIDGMDRVLPIGRRWPRLFQKVYVVYGSPIDYGDLADEPRSRDTAQRLVDRVMDVLRRQQEEIRQLQA
ncbi:MAG: 1-acyl-sn-glycerol-3-phosphate acyltransferase [Gemmatimonadota bacterium]|nr:MAG: 1-acyl-sn-glycerol-3-phosphate acyltransferase [Gemmatimonadota bacterium]